MILTTNKAFSIEYISGACNSVPFAADWGAEDKLCFAIDDGVAILDPNLERNKVGKIEDVFFFHKSRINAIKWIRSHKSEDNSLVSASIDGLIIVWSLNNLGKFIPTCSLSGHPEIVTDIDGLSLKLPDSSTCVFIASMSLSYLKLWKKTNFDENLVCFGTFEYPDVGFGVSGLSLVLLPGSESLILASSKNFTDISIFVSSLIPKDGDIHSYRELVCLKGHTNWINDISFATADNGSELLLASASHDCTLRIWGIKRWQNVQQELRLLEFPFSVENKEYVVTLYSILHGHDHWVYSVQWKYFDSETSEKENLKLLSVSADKNVIVWKRDLELNTWVEQYRLGDVGGNSTGFLGGRFNSSGEFIFCHDLLGSFHLWQYQKNLDTWSPLMLPSGHHDEVSDIQWDPMGQFLMSVSADKTCRLHAPWKENPNCWYEFSRPQTHGHVISCVAVLPEFRFISGASEKELRFFIAPKTFVQNFKKASFIKFDFDEKKYPHNSAILPSLDLSNKPTNEVENININIVEKGLQTDENLPNEGQLSQNTLWPEIQKLYYHPNEISCVTANFDGSLVASSCKASSANEATIAIWAIKQWNCIERIQELSYHQLTVTQLSFSPNSIFLLSVSRDRTWYLFKRNDNDLFDFVSSTSKTNSVHKRQLQCCCWSHDSKYFVTGSRDGKVVIWMIPSDTTKSDESPVNLNSLCTITLNDDIRSVSVAPEFVTNSQYLLAMGCGSGKIELHTWNMSGNKKWITLQNHSAHQKAVTKVAFRPVSGSPNSSKTNILQLASSGANRLIMIYNLDVEQI